MLEELEELDESSFTIIVSFSLAFSFSPLTANVRLNSPVVFSFNLFTVFLFRVIVTSTLLPFFKLLCLLKEISGFDNRLEISELELVTSGTFLISTSGFPSPSAPYVMKLTSYVAKSIILSFLRIYYIRSIMLLLEQQK